MDIIWLQKNYNQPFIRIFSKQHLLILVVAAHLFVSECLPAARRLLRLLQHSDGAAAEAECRVDGVCEPSDRRKERSEEPHVALGRRAPTLSAGWPGIRRQRESIAEKTKSVRG